MPIYWDLAVTWSQTDNRRTKMITLPLVHSHRVIILSPFRYKLAYQIHNQIRFTSALIIKLIPRLVKRLDSDLDQMPSVNGWRYNMYTLNNRRWRWCHRGRSWRRRNTSWDYRWLRIERWSCNRGRLIRWLIPHGLTIVSITFVFWTSILKPYLNNLKVTDKPMIKYG